MWNEKPCLNRIVEISTQRKSNGAVGGGRKGNSGKKGVIYQLDQKGVKTELARAEGPTFRALSRNLRSTGFLPNHVAINSHGETAF